MPRSGCGVFGDALNSLHAALDLDRNRPQAHFLLGTLLASDPAHREEALGHLRLAARSIPSAQAVLERVRTAMARQGQ